MREPTPERPRLLIPGPTEVHPEVAEAGAWPMIGHRGPEISELLEDVLPRVGRILGTEGSVFPLGSSATGAMEVNDGTRIGPLVIRPVWAKIHWKVMNRT